MPLLGRAVDGGCLVGVIKKFRSGDGVRLGVTSGNHLQPQIIYPYCKLETGLQIPNRVPIYIDILKEKLIKGVTELYDLFRMFLSRYLRLLTLKLITNI